MFEIFDAERDAGFTEDVLLKGFSLASQVGFSDQVVKISEGILAHSTKATNQNQLDLAYLSTVLVTTGANKNDDVFDRVHTWAARHSPEDKPFNYEHDQSDIIGHITGCYVVDDEFKTVADDTALESLPAKYHIVTTAVLYKKWEDDKLQQRMNKILAEIAEDKWFVSMECLFSNYDYLLIAPKSNETVVKARTAETAFLTKHLRAYGGTGEYDGYKVKRVLKNILFSGKGLVRDPANPESIIINDALAGVTKTNEEVNTTMANDNAEKISELTAEVGLLRKERDEAVAKAAEAAKASVDAEISSLKAEVKARDTLVSELKTKIEATEKLLAEKTKEKEVSDKEKKEMEEAKSAIEKELAAAKLAQAKQDKVSKLVAAGLTHDEAAAKADKFVGVPDEAFAEYVEVVKTKAASDKTDEEEVDDEDLDEEEDEAEAKRAAAAAKKLEEAVPDKDISYAMNISDDRKKALAGMAQFIKSQVEKAKASKK